jgi:hypothetical protein
MTTDTTTATPRGRWAAIRDGVAATVGAVLGLAPHVVHHAGLLVGTALVTGAGGNALFFLIGLLFSLPMLRRLYRRFGTWKAPAIAAGVFTALFSVSAFVIGPALSGDSSPDESPTPPSQTPTGDHSEHHSP